MQSRSFQNKALLLVSFLSWLLLYQFSREIFYWARPIVYQFYFTGLGKLFLRIFRDTLHFTADNPDFWIKIIFSCLYILTYLIFLGLYFGFKSIKPLLSRFSLDFLSFRLGLMFYEKSFISNLLCFFQEIQMI